MAATGHPSGPVANPEAVLGVAPGATADEIEAAWRAYVKAHHPDRGGDPGAFLLGRSAREQLHRRRTSAPAPGQIRGVPGRRRLIIRRLRDRLGTVFPSLAPPPSRVD